MSERRTNQGQGQGQGSLQGEMPAEHALLGLLDREHGTGHGYDLARSFGEGQPLAEIIRLEPGMLYHHLKKLARAGWVTSSVEPQGTRPPRQVYQITEAGRTELRRWLAEPVARTREIRLEFLVKLYFARHVDGELAQRLIVEQRQTLLDRERSLATQLSHLPPHPESPGDDVSFSRHVLELRLAQTRAALSWLHHLERSFEASVTGAPRTKSANR